MDAEQSTSNRPTDVLAAGPEIELSDDVRRQAARLMGQARSAAKTEAARRNARKGGHPKGMKLSKATKRKISEVKRRSSVPEPRTPVPE
jgi:hypothetical protein